MEFFDYTSSYEILTKRAQNRPKFDEFYNAMTRSSAAGSFNLYPDSAVSPSGYHTANNQFNAEWDWYESNKPYYKIWPSILPLLCNTKIDVPAQFLHSPFKSFLIRLPKENNYLKIDDNHCVRTIMVHERINDDPGAIIINLGNKIPNETSRMLVWLDIGEVDIINMTDDDNAPPQQLTTMPVYTYIQAVFTSDGSIEDGFNRLHRDSSWMEGIVLPDSIVNAVERLVVSVCFLATGADSLIDYDILNKHIERYHKSTDPKEKKQLQEKAKRVGKYGWTVGRQEKQELILGGYDIRHGKSEPTDTGRELHYQHQRSAHFHVVRHGPGKSLSRVQFYRQTSVRPDLPPPPFDRGYKTQKDL